MDWNYTKSKVVMLAPPNRGYDKVMSGKLWSKEARKLIVVWLCVPLDAGFGTTSR